MMMFHMKSFHAIIHICNNDLLINDAFRLQGKEYKGKFSLPITINKFIHYNFFSEIEQLKTKWNLS